MQPTLAAVLDKLLGLQDNLESRLNSIEEAQKDLATSQKAVLQSVMDSRGDVLAKMDEMMSRHAVPQEEVQSDPFALKTMASPAFADLESSGSSRKLLHDSLRKWRVQGPKAARIESSATMNRSGQNILARQSVDRANLSSDSPTEALDSSKPESPKQPPKQVIESPKKDALSPDGSVVPPQTAPPQSVDAATSDPPDQSPESGDSGSGSLSDESSETSVIEEEGSWWQVGVLLPDGRFKQAWNAIWLLLCFVEYWSITLSLVVPDDPFAPGLITPQAILFVLSITVFYILDMGVQSRTAYRSEASICDDSVQEVRRHYFWHSFPVDLLLTIPWGLCLLPFGAMWWTVGQCVHLLRPLRALRLFQWSNSLEQMPGHMAVQRTFFFLLIAIHSLVVGSILFFKHFDSEDSLIGAVGDDGKLWDPWVIGFYWVFTCLSTVGFGDIYPTTNAVRLYSLAVMIFSIWMNMHLLSAGLAPALQSGVLQEKMDQKKRRLSEFLRFYNVPWETQKQVFTIYPIVLEGCLHDVEEVGELPEYLQRRIYDHIKVSMLSKVPLLRPASANCKMALATFLTHVVFPPSALVIREGDEGDCMFFLIKGVVEVLQQRGAAEVLQCTLKEGSWFGETALVEECTRTASVRAVTTCSLFRLDKDGFRSVLRQFPSFAQAFCRPTTATVATVRTGAGLAHVAKRWLSSIQRTHTPGPEYHVKVPRRSLVPQSCGLDGLTIGANRRHWSLVKDKFLDRPADGASETPDSAQPLPEGPPEPDVHRARSGLYKEPSPNAVHDEGLAMSFRMQMSPRSVVSSSPRASRSKDPLGSPVVDASDSLLSPREQCSGSEIPGQLPEGNGQSQ